MILNVTPAIYKGGHQILVTFNTGETKLVDLSSTLKNEKRKIFEQLKNENYFQKFVVQFNTVIWENEADFAPEFLYSIGKNI